MVCVVVNPKNLFQLINLLVQLIAALHRISVLLSSPVHVSDTLLVIIW
jgi:hypothetical protein